MLDFISAGCAFGVTIIVVLKLTWLHRVYNPLERVGLGLLGGPSFMLSLSMMEGPDSPFRLWAFTIFMVGLFVFLLGRLRRQIKHWQANERQKELSRQHFERKAMR